MLKNTIAVLFIILLVNSLFAQNGELTKVMDFKTKDSFSECAMLPNGNAITFSLEYTGNGNTQTIAVVKEYDAAGVLVGEDKHKQSSQLSKTDKYGGVFKHNGIIYSMFYDILEDGVQLFISRIDGYDKIKVASKIKLKGIYSFNYYDTFKSNNGEFIGLIDSQTYRVLVLNKDLDEVCIIDWGRPKTNFKLMAYAITDDGHYAGVVLESDEKKKAIKYATLVKGSVLIDETIDIPVEGADKVGETNEQGIALNVHSNNTIVLTIIGGENKYTAVGPMLFQVYDIAMGTRMANELINMNEFGFGVGSKQISLWSYYTNADFIDFALPTSEKSILFGIPTYIGKPGTRQSFDDNYDLLEIDLTGAIISHNQLLTETDNNVDCFVQPIKLGDEWQLIFTTIGKTIPSKEIVNLNLSHAVEDCNSYYFKYQKGGKLAAGNSKFKEMGLNIGRANFSNGKDYFFVGMLDKKMSRLFSFK